MGVRAGGGLGLKPVLVLLPSRRASEERAPLPGCLPLERGERKVGEGHAGCGSGVHVHPNSTCPEA